MNSLRFVAYEWNELDASDGAYIGPRYEKRVMIRASAPTGAIDKGLLEQASP